MKYKIFPYHIFIEVLGLILFVTLAILFIKWENSEVLLPFKRLP